MAHPNTLPSTERDNHLETLPTSIDQRSLQTPSQKCQVSMALQTISQESSTTIRFKMRTNSNNAHPKTAITRDLLVSLQFSYNKSHRLNTINRCRMHRLSKLASSNSST